MVSQPQAPQTTNVRVPLADRSYEIRIGQGLLRQIHDMIGLDDMTHAVVVGDQAVASPWCQTVEQSLTAAGIRVDTMHVPSGEQSKSITQLDDILQWMLACQCDRRSVLFAVGGGVVGDLAGFAAASFARGIRFVQIPTTLLAMVDSSVGGKTGINLPAAKNMVGAFWQPSAVIIDTAALSTLPDRSYISGLAEVIKYGVIDDVEFFEWLESNADGLVDRQPAAQSYAIERSCRSKSRVVGADERETSGRRAILNYGHTFAHAIEATTGYGTWMHGEAVAIGMQMAAELAAVIGLTDRELLDRQSDLITNCRLPTRLPAPQIDAMLTVMQRDKKVEHGKLRFILPAGLGQVDLVGDVDQAAVVQSIRRWSDD